MTFLWLRSTSSFAARLAARRAAAATTIISTTRSRSSSFLAPPPTTTSNRGTLNSQRVIPSSSRQPLSSTSSATSTASAATSSSSTAASSSVSGLEKQPTTTTTTTATTTTRRTRPAVLPTRHSRHLSPPVCRKEDERKVLTTRYLLNNSDDTDTDTEQSSLFVEYDVSQEDDLWASNDAIIQMAEYVILGHGSCIPHSIHYLDDSPQDDTIIVQEQQQQQQHIDTMQAIVKKLEQENQVYMTLRTQLLHSKSSLQLTTRRDGEEQDEDSENSQPQDSTSPAAPPPPAAGPGPTVAMYDALLDGMAVMAASGAAAAAGWKNHTTPMDFFHVLQDVLHRHELDGGPEANTNPHTVPTILTFNAVLRGIANLPYNSNDHDENEYPQEQELRDDALQVAFGVYDEMKRHVDRNEATFTYLLQVVAKYLPPSLTRANVAHGIWTQATLHHVASSQVLQAMHQASSASSKNDNNDNNEGGVVLPPEYDEWLQKYDDIRKTPLKWRKDYKKKRFRRNSATY